VLRVAGYYRHLVNTHDVSFFLGRLRGCDRTGGPGIAERKKNERVDWKKREGGKLHFLSGIKSQPSGWLNTRHPKSSYSGRNLWGWYLYGEWHADPTDFLSQNLPIEVAEPGPIYTDRTKKLAYQAQSPVGKQ
jgi:hypothetical protein